jgi:hypothetical protein
VIARARARAAIVSGRFIEVSCCESRKNCVLVAGRWSLVAGQGASMAWSLIMASPIRK